MCTSNINSYKTNSDFEQFLYPSVTSPIRLFGKEENEFRNYLIPGYQRPYEWDKEQLDGLLTSITTNFEQDCQPLLLGTIQLNRTPNKQYEIIDGQQRLTTLWLILTTLNELLNETLSNLRFCPENQINSRYKDDLSNAARKQVQIANPTYRQNYEYIYQLIDDYSKATNKENQSDSASIQHRLRNFILQRIVFVEIITDFGTEESIERTIQIFDSLNTTGLPLDTKDLFKIKFNNYLRNGSGNDYFEAINNAYDKIAMTARFGSCYALAEEDLLDTFRFYIIAKTKKIAAAELLKQSNLVFFENIFSKDRYNWITIERFTDISSVMHETQRIMNERDKKAMNNLLNCAKELFDWSGYGRLKNIFFTLVYAQVQNDVNSLCDCHIEIALTIMELLWKSCSLMHSTIGKVVTAMYNSIGEMLYDFVKSPENARHVDSVTVTLAKPVESWIERTKNFGSLFAQSGNLFGNTRAYLFVALSHIQDCDNETTALSIKNGIFYHNENNTKSEIEHIASHALYETDESFKAVNSIGNLMFIERNINRSLGRKTAQFRNSPDAQDDARNKDLASKKEQYPKSTISGKSAVLKRLEGCSDHEKLKEMITTRSNKKAAHILGLYSDFMPRSNS